MSWTVFQTFHGPGAGTVAVKLVGCTQKARRLYLNDAQN
jgi:hypothetical protein